MNITKLRCSKEIYRAEKTKKQQIVICRADDNYPVHYMVDTVGNVFSQVPENYWIERTGCGINKSILFVGLQSKGPLVQSGSYFFPVEIRNNYTHAVKIKGLKTRATEVITPEGYIAISRWTDFGCTDCWRGFRYFESYADKQLNALGELLNELAEKHKIPTKFQGDRCWMVNGHAIEGEPGIYSETAYSHYVNFPYPENRLNEILKSIE